MIRYQIEMSKPGAILDVGGLAERVVATGVQARIVVYVCRENKEKFEKLVEGSRSVLSYKAHPCNPEAGKVVA